MYRYRRRIAMMSVGAQLRCPVRRRIEGEIEIARPVEIVFETTRSHTPTRFFFSRVLSRSWWTSWAPHALTTVG